MKKEPVEIKINSDINQQILNTIIPAGLDFSNTHANLGESYGKIYCISKYPSDGVDYGWLAPLCNLEGTTTSVEFRYTDSARLIEVYNKKISELKADRDLAKQESDKQQLDAAINDLKEMIHRLAVSGEPVGYVNVMLHIQDTSENLLNNRIKRVSGRVSVIGCNLKLLKYKQINALKCMSPYGVPNREVANIGARNMPMSTFTGGFPMANSGINDVGGSYFGKTKQNRLIILNQWLRNKDRVNSNWFITGVPGVGKSSFVKKFMVNEYAFGTKMIVFDPEEEYVDLANHPDIAGDVIDGAGGSTGRINPLQIRRSPRITQEDLEENESLADFFEYDESNGISDMALHIQNLHVFFKCLFGNEYTSSIKTALEQCLIESYNRKDIFWDTDISNIPCEKLPIMAELYDVVEEKTKTENLSEYRRSNYDHLLDLLYPHCKGSNQFMWNGPTTINPRTKFIVLNVSKLLDMDDNVRRAQFMNLSMWAWNESSADRTEKVQFVVDEGYLFVDEEYPELLKWMRNYSKRDRKYEAGLSFITHSVVDVLDPAVKRFGQAIIDNACYKFIMGCDGKNLEETKKLFNLTEQEENLLVAKNRGKGILFAGGVRLDMQVEIREKFLEMFGKAGGR